jgi:Zn-dependent peptidase ImmA (M78 family)
VASREANRGAKRAREARAALGLGDGPLRCVVDAVETAGGVGVLSLELPAGVAGAYDPAGPWLYVNQRDPVVRQRFTVAHEFGHHRLGHHDLKIIDSPEDLAGGRHDPREVEANAFAAEFLAPLTGVRAWWEAAGAQRADLEVVCRLAARFGMSGPAALIRLETAKLVDAARGRRLHEEVEQGLHHEVAARLGLDAARDDELTRAVEAQELRLPPAVRASPLGRHLAREITLAEAARLAGVREDELAAALESLRI